MYNTVKCTIYSIHYNIYQYICIILAEQIPKYSIHLTQVADLQILFTYSSYFSMCVCLVAQSCPTLCDPLQPTRLLCLWDFSGKNTGVGCHFLLQGIFPTQGSNSCLLCLLHCRWILYPLSIFSYITRIFYSEFLLFIQ